MSTALASRIAALGLWAIYIGECSRNAAIELIEQGIKPPIGSGHPVEVFTVCGLGAFEQVINPMMPANTKIRMRLEFKPIPHFHLVDKWENDAGNRQVVTVFCPDEQMFLTACLGTDQMQRPIQSASTAQAMRAHLILITMVQNGQL